MGSTRISRLSLAAAAAALIALGAALPAAADGFEADEYFDDIYDQYDDGTVFFPHAPGGGGVVHEPGYYDSWDDHFYEDLYD
jgi:hypothetical protein